MPPSFPHRGSSDLDPVGAPHGRDGPHALVCRAHGALLRHPVRPCAGRTGTPMPSSPSLDPDALAHSAHLQALIREQIAAAGGAVPFSRFMELALYAPGLGYYSAGATAPAMHCANSEPSSGAVTKSPADRKSTRLNSSH